MLALYLCALGVVGLLRLVELRISARNLARASEQAVCVEGRGRYGALVATNVLLLVLPPLEAVARGGPAPAPLLFGALALALCCQIVRAWTMIALGAAWNARGVVDPAQPLSSRGPYRWLRHPGYLAVAVEFVALPVAGGAWISLLLLFPPIVWLLLRRAADEESLLGLPPGGRISIRTRAAMPPSARSRRHPA